MADNWIELAPKPDALAPGKNWRVLISYGSLSLPWALALYDILNRLDYKIFLDQYVLSAAAPLALSLGEALDRARALSSYGRGSMGILNGAKRSSRPWRRWRTRKGDSAMS